MKQFDERPSPYGTVTVLKHPHRSGSALLVPDTGLKQHTWKQTEPGLIFMHPESIEELKTAMAFDEWMTRAERRLLVRVELEMTAALAGC